MPPGAHTRVTTPRDLGRALFRLHAAALGRPWALRATGLSREQANTGRTLLLGSQPTGDNAGLFRRWLAEKRLVQKHGWISDSRLSAAIVYRRSGPVIVVVAAYRPGVTLREAQLLGREVLRAAAPRRVAVRYLTLAVAGLSVPAALAACTSRVCFSSR